MNDLLVSGSKPFRQVITELAEITYQHQRPVSFQPPAITLVNGETVEFEICIQLKPKVN